MGTTDKWLPLYIGDYQKDTGHLTAAEHGAYLLLIMQAWTHDGVLPTDEKQLRILSRMDPKEWKNSRLTVLAFFRRDGDTYRHKRIDEELENAKTLVDQRILAGKASAEARKLKRKPNISPTSVGTSVGTSVETSDGASDGTSVPTDVDTSVATEGQRNGRPSPSPETEEESKQAAGAKSLEGVSMHFQEFVFREKGTNRQCVGSSYLDRAIERVYEAARIDDTKWFGTYEYIIKWLHDGFELDKIVEAIAESVERNPNYRVPSTLKYFDNPVRIANGQAPIPRHH